MYITILVKQVYWYISRVAGERFYSFQYSLLILCRYVPDILKICMKKYYAEKMNFDKFTAF